MLPIRATKGSAGYDLYCNEAVTLKSGELKKIPLAIKVNCPEGYWAKIEGRSSLALKGIYPAGGIIDNDYHGEISVIMYNVSEEEHTFEKDDRIAQLVFIPLLLTNETTLSTEERGEGGFGSTNK